MNNTKEKKIVIILAVIWLVLMCTAWLYSGFVPLINSLRQVPAATPNIFFLCLNFTIVGLVVFLPLEICINCLAKRAGMNVIKTIALIMTIIHLSCIPITILLYFTRLLT